MRIRQLGGIVAVIAAAACGGGSGGNGSGTGSGPKDLDPFVGIYNATSNLVMVVDGQSFPENESARISVGRGLHSDLVLDLGLLIPGCEVEAKGSGPTSFTSVATSCSVNNQCGGKRTVNIPASTFSLAKKTISLSWKGSLGVTCSDGSSSSGAYTWNIDGTKQ